MNQIDLLSDVYEHHHKDIFNMAARITGSIEDAEDITQESFIKAYKNLDTFKGESKLSTWIFSIARNECLRFLREKKKNRFHDIEALMKEAKKTDQSTNHSDEEKPDYIDQVKEGCLTGLLQCLSSCQRFAFVLNTLFKLPLSETADIIGKSEGATKALVFRARKNLKGFLCKNCSLYDPKNSCKCEDLISFSLNNSWIKKPSGKTIRSRTDIDIQLISKDLNEVKKIVKLYQSIRDHNPPKDLKDKLNEKLKNLEKKYPKKA